MATRTAEASQARRLLAPFSWGTLFFLFGVILWGGYVRASGSGAGCGNHWPLCNGVVVPDSASWKTMVEFTHRITSGLSLLLCAGICWLSFREAPKGSLIRKAGVATLIFILSEALIGAALVLLRLVEQDQSALRAVSMSIHLCNTFVLLASVALTAHWARFREPFLASRKRSVLIFSVVAALSVLVLGASGAVTALGDTLFPSQSVAQGLAQDFSPTRNFLVHLRLYHPLIALSVSLYLLVFARWVIRSHRDEPPVVFHAIMLVALQCAQLLLGGMNVLLLAPVSVQMLHLLVSDLVWVDLILLVSHLFVRDRASALPV